MARAERKQQLGRKQAVEVLTVFALQLHPTSETTTKKNRVDHATPGDGGLGEEIPKCT